MYYSFNTSILPHISFMNTCTTPSNWRHPKRTPREYVLLIVTSGEMYLQEDDIPYTLRQGDYIFLSPFHTHFGYRDSQCDYFYIHFQPDCLSPWDCREITQIMQIIIDNKKLAFQCDPFGSDFYTKHKLFIPKDRHIYSYFALQQIMIHMKEITTLEKKQISHYKLSCSSVFIQILILLSNDFVANLFPEQEADVNEQNSAKVYPLIHYLHMNFAQQMTGEQISKEFHTNFDSLNRLFKKETGLTIFLYLKQIRLNHARELLTTTQLNLAEISAKVGFCDQYYFSRVFKAEFGQSPKKYSSQYLPKNATS